MDTHYLLTVTVKRVERPARTAGQAISGKGSEREMTDELHLVRRAEQLPAALEYAAQVLTLERNNLAQNADGGDAWERAAEMFPKVRQSILETGGRGITSTGLDAAACQVVYAATGVRLALENGRVAP